VTQAAWLAPVLDAEGMQRADSWAIEEQGLASLELMETAGGAVADGAAGIARDGPVRIVCGKGNNGGDGLVAARALIEGGREAEALLLWPEDELSEDSAANLARLREVGGAARTVEPGDLPQRLGGSGAIVDAIFGTGFAGAPREPADAAIEAINAAGAPVLACDIASGVDGSSGRVEGVAVRADLTVTFHRPKVGQLVAPGKEATGELRVVDIGIPQEAPGEPAAGIIGSEVLAGLPPRGAGSTKFSSGQVVLVGGSRGLTGAMAMASSAAIRSGAGYATALVPGSLEPVLESKLTEVMTRGLPEEDGSLVPGGCEAALEAADGAGCVVLGPGLGRTEGALSLGRELARAVPAPLLIDADGLNALGTDLEQLAGRQHPTILTPHAGELGRLLDRASGEVAAERLASAREAAERSGAAVVLKGDDTIVVAGERIAVNAAGSPGLATAGTGDVLSGVIAALVARGVEPFEAACAGVLAHARAGGLAAERLGAESVIATDVIEELPGGLRA
jgi:ADP-dependent NAD(P)H-hydrate dehydratase / NAD(P)H-hydrate epimerase